MNKKKLKNAKNKALKALKWIIISGTALTALNAISTLLGALQSGNINSGEFFKQVGYTIAFMLINTLIYAISQYKIPEK